MEDLSRKVFAERLRYARETLRGLKQSELAEMAKLPSTSISHFENPEGTRKPSFDNLRRLANSLGVTTDYLLGLSDDYVATSADASALYRDVQNLTEVDKKFAQLLIQQMLDKNKAKE